MQMLLKSAKIRTDALHKSVSLLPWTTPCLIKTGNTLNGIKMFSWASKTPLSTFPKLHIGLLLSYGSVKKPIEFGVKLQTLTW